MGVKDLWNILSPAMEQTTVNSLRGKCIAVDLSVWVCESSTSSWAQTQFVKNAHLRTLFFRAVFLAGRDVNLVFVTDGVAPDLKADVMAERNSRRGLATQASDAPRTRKHFAGVIKKCVRMLEMMGFCCVASDGEAECTCAHLDSEGIVDGCFTQDSDAFLYGARTVYRNFRMVKQRGGGGAIFEMYTANRIEELLKLNRESLIAAALLLGCDYDSKGVQGVGKEKVLKLLTEIWIDENPLEKLRRWRTESEEFRLRSISQANKSSSPKCSHCGHAGRSNIHKKNGCVTCGTRSGCHSETSQEVSLNDGKSTIEVGVREKAVTDPEFPNERVIAEFMEKKPFAKDRIKKSLCALPPPDLPKLIPFLVKELDWSVDYCLEKSFPLLTSWIVKNGLPENSNDDFPTPEKIVKKCVREGMNCYEVLWKPTKYLRDIAKECEESFNWLSDESQLFFSKSFEALETEFLKSIAKPVKVKKPKEVKVKAPKKAAMKKVKETVASHDLREMFTQMCLKDTCENHDENHSKDKPGSSTDSAMSQPAEKVPPAEDEKADEERVSNSSSVEENGSDWSSDEDDVSESELSKVIDSLISGVPAKTPVVNRGRKVDKENFHVWDLKDLAIDQSASTPSTFCNLDKTRPSMASMQVPASTLKQNIPN
ncbi:unnamed protein product [Notodromas monacha]|uniref:Flap endonuclease GEN-like 1 n=1 Tax=Notodromas monacha TaxID=399045 RepID=A0A7R9GDC9_9CRUS|nr:unnamed protein product [Notodromas monacha]CAG0916831.1 unnamed protein product [Notodromas monacha]